MEKEIIFIKLNKFHSRAKDKDYYTIEYIDPEDKKYYMEFITPERYDKIAEKEPQFLENVIATYRIGNNRRLEIDTIN